MDGVGDYTYIAWLWCGLKW